MTTQNDRRTSERGGFIGMAALAATLGAGAAILFAPEEGAKTRQRVGRGLESIRGEAAGTITYLQRELRRRRRQSQREKRLAALMGVLVGAGIAALLMTERGTSTRKRLGGTLSRIKVGAVDRIDRLRERARETTKDRNPEEQPIRSVQELGRDPDSVF
ncbi:MAG TPA: YtxH domain-containing protein [Gemmatimonadales bacterium]|nr:YtxH domain-containing protein [Gemmatimonadales bacterium]